MPLKNNETSKKTYSVEPILEVIEEKTSIVSG
jgi:hypothetical protein